VSEEAQLPGPESNQSGPPVDVLSDRSAQDPGTVSLAEVLAENAVVHVADDHSYMIVTPKGPDDYNDGNIALREPNIGKQAAVVEMGYTAPSPFTSWTRRDQNTKLQGLQGLQTYYNMRRQDGAIRASLRLLKTPVQGAHWFVEPWVADDNTPATTRDKNIANFVARNIFEQLNVCWSTLLTDVLLMADYGYMCFEKVYQKSIDGKMRLQKLAPRHPLDIQEWEYDAHGGPNAAIMYPNPYSGPSEISVGTGMDPLEERSIPINKLVVFTHEAEAGDLTGIPVLRSAYKHWYYKDTLYKIDAIQKERHGIGIPVIKLPPGFGKDDQALAENLGRNLRTNERGHITLPPLWDVTFAEIKGQPVDCMKSIEHHDMKIKSNVLGSFLDNPGGSSDPNIDIFLKSTRYLADQIADIFNKYVIPQLVDINFDLGGTRGYPALRARRIGEWEDLRTLSFAVRNLVSIDALRPDDVLESHLRREMDLPPADVNTARSPVLVRPNTATAPIAPGEETAISDFGLTQAVQAQQGAQAQLTPPGGKQNMNKNKVGAPRQTPSAASKASRTGGSDRSGG
jgi:hypothetical protein